MANLEDSSRDCAVDAAVVVSIRCSLFFSARANLSYQIIQQLHRINCSEQALNTDVLESRTLLKFGELRQVLSSRFERFSKEEWSAFQKGLHGGGE